MFEYLQDSQRYIDLHDLYTIEECLGYKRALQEFLKKRRSSEEFKEYNDEEFDKEVDWLTNFKVNVLKAQWYKDKKETIQKWTDKDRKNQEKFDKAIPPVGILCKHCFSPIEFNFKELWYSHKENAKIVFWFECPNCKKRRAIYEDGKEWLPKECKCPKCNSTLNRKSKFLNNILTINYSCPNCSYSKKEVDDFNKDEKEMEEKRARENNLLVEYRKEFCDDKECEKILHNLENFSNLMHELEEKAKKNKDPLIQKARQLNKLSFIQLEKLIADNIEKEGYKDLKFGKPEMGKNVIIDFSVIETKEDRKEYNSQNTLKKLIREVLKDTNWRLMSEGIDYRLGILTGRLKAYEQEEDLVEIVKKGKG